jgi:hypothetical protein
MGSGQCPDCRSAQSAVAGQHAPDGAGHGTYGYAKNDVTLTVPANLITSDTLPALTYATGDIPIRALAASTTHKVTIPLPQWFTRTFSLLSSNPSGQSAAPHGILVKSLMLNYRVNTTTITSFNTMAINYCTLAAGGAIPTVTEMTSTLAGNTLTAAANAYAAVSTVTTPAFVSLADALIWAVATIVVPGSSTVDIFGASWRVAYAMY